ncbi:hypothetical protein PYV61_18325, partial [Roseisolibacter sp. H3M3-2]
MLNRVRPVAALAATAALSALAACAPDPVEWAAPDERRVRVPAPTPDRPIAFPDAVAESLLVDALGAALALAADAA